MTWRPKWQNFERRAWEEIKNSWLGNIPVFPAIGAKPDHGLDHFQPLLEISIPSDKSRLPDIPGIRSLALWEAVYLFHKCSHTNLAAQRLADRGMHSWCLFNAYHSAYLGARGTMALLGIALPNLAGRQVAIDLFVPSNNRQRRQLASPQFQEFLILSLPLIDQRHLWEGYKRMINISTVSCWDNSIKDELYGVDYEDFSRPRNGFLYRADTWPLDDLMSDADGSGMADLLGVELDAQNNGFLLRLSFMVYRLFEQLMIDLGSVSSIIRDQIEHSRCFNLTEIQELSTYRTFISQTSEGVSL
jgi:hypothetical protein